MQALLEGDAASGRSVLRDSINATIGFEALAEANQTPPKSLMRMFGPRGNPTAGIMLSVIGALKTFDVPYLVTVGGPNYATEFLGTFIYRISIPQAEVGYGAALSILLLILALSGAIAFGLRGMRRN